MYITVTNNNRKIGFKGLEVTDLIIGLPLFFILFFLFSFNEFRTLALIIFIISIFMFIPINISKKNRMYKIIFLIISYIAKPKIFVIKKEENNERSKRFKLLKTIYRKI